MGKIWANSGDSHLVEPADLFTERLPADLAARMPRSVRDDDGRHETLYIDGKHWRILGADGTLLKDCLLYTSDAADE